MIGSDANGNELGLIPCGLSWLFRFLNYVKEKTKRRYHVRVSAIEVHGRSEKLKDLLRGVAGGMQGDIRVSPSKFYSLRYIQFLLAFPVN